MYIIMPCFTFAFAVQRIAKSYVGIIVFMNSRPLPDLRPFSLFSASERVATDS